MTLDRLCSLFLALYREIGGKDASEQIEEALTPMNRINPVTGVPYGWQETDELDGLDAILTG